jgi:lysophospholipase L1-like esterase
VTPPRLRQALVAGLLWTAGLQFIAGCDSAADSRDAGRAAVFIVGLNHLRPPAVPAAGVYEPAAWFSPVPDREAAGFILDVASAEPAQLRLSWHEADSTLGFDGLRLPAAPQADFLNTPPNRWDLPAEAADLLAAGHVVYWPAAAASAGHQLLAVALPRDRLVRAGTLQVYDFTAADGAPIGADRIELTPGFFYMAAIGDSAMWGNGLRDRDKFSTLVAAHIERQLGVKVVRQVYAVSGARIVSQEGDGHCVGRCNGEVPKAIPSIRTQIGFIEHPELVDLLLVNGCGNDVGVDKLLSQDTTVAEIVDLAHAACEESMLELLRDVEAAVPRAALIVTGYFPLISEQSSLGALQEWLTTFDEPIVRPEDIDTLLAMLTEKTSTFYTVSQSGLSAAVETLRQEHPERTVALAQPPWAPDHATFAPDPWLWGLTGNVDIAVLANFGLGLTLLPEDPLLNERLGACGQPGAYHGLLTCVFSSVGHPNIAGARAVADSIIARLVELGIVTE